jgi:hypothetical protein
MPEGPRHPSPRALRDHPSTGHTTGRLRPASSSNTPATAIASPAPIDHGTTGAGPVTGSDPPGPPPPALADPFGVSAGGLAAGVGLSVTTGGVDGVSTGTDGLAEGELEGVEDTDGDTLGDPEGDDAGELAGGLLEHRAHCAGPRDHRPVGSPVTITRFHR